VLMTTTLSVPVVLVGENSKITSILEVETDGTSTHSDFQRQLAIGLCKSGKLLGDLRFQGNPLISDSRLHHFAAAKSRSPRFTATFTKARAGSPGQLLFVKTSTGRIISLIHK